MDTVPEYVQMPRTEMIAGQKDTWELETNEFEYAKRSRSRSCALNCTVTELCTSNLMPPDVMSASLYSTNSEFTEMTSCESLNEPSEVMTGMWCTCMLVTVSGARVASASSAGRPKRLNS